MNDGELLVMYDMVSENHNKIIYIIIGLLIFALIIIAFQGYLLYKNKLFTKINYPQINYPQIDYPQK